MKKMLLWLVLILSGLAGEVQAQNPEGYIRKILKDGRIITAVRVDSYAEMQSQCSSGSPKQFVVETDEHSDTPNALYYWDGFKLHAGSSSGGGSGSSGDASDIVSGTLPDARLSTNVTLNTSPAVITNKVISGETNTLVEIPQSAVKNLESAIASKQDNLGFEPVSLSGHYKYPAFIDSLDKGRVGLGLANNTPDLEKPISNLTQAALNAKQGTLVSGTNIKTVNGTSLVGSGNVTITGTPTTDASALTTGTLPDARISSNYPTLSSTGTFTAKTISGLSNTFTNIPQSAVSSLVGDLSGKQATLVSGTNLKSINGTTLLGSGDITVADLGTTQTFSAAKTFSSTANFRSTWANKHAVFGTTGQAGVIGFGRSSDGAVQARVGYKSAGESNAFEVINPSGSGTVELGSTAGTALKVFNDSRVVVQRGGTHTNSGTHDFQVNGSSAVSNFMKVGGGVTFNADSLKTFEDNAAAVAGGLPPGKLFKSEAENGDWLVKITRPVDPNPIFGEKVSSGNTRVLWPGTALEQQYKAQSANEDHNIRRATNRTAPIYRFEINQGENWATDISNGNDNNIGGVVRVKERTEMYQEGVSLPFDTDIWVAYSIYIEPGADITYSNTDHYCMIGQWHPGGTVTGGPSWAFELSGQGNINLLTRGQQSLTMPFPAGQPFGVDRANTTVTRGAWHDIVIRTRHNKDSGQIQWWVDGFEIYNGTGLPIGYSQANSGYWKYGIYRTSNPNNLAVRYANVEVSTTSLFGRVGSELPVNN